MFHVCVCVCKQRNQLPEFIPSNSNSGLHSCISIQHLLLHSTCHLNNKALKARTKNSPDKGLMSSPHLDPHLGWPWKSYRRECFIDLNKYHYLVCGCIEFDCGRTYDVRTDIRTDIFTGFIRSSQRRLRWPNLKTKKNKKFICSLDTDQVIHHRWTGVLRR